VPGGSRALCFHNVRKLPIFSLLFLFPLFGCNNQTNRASHTRTQQAHRLPDGTTITEVHVWSRNIDAPLSYTVIMPPHDSAEHLPVLYLLHGANSGPAEILSHSDVGHLALLNRLVVVIPEAGNSYYTNAQHLKNARWEDVITIDLPADVTSHFPLQHGHNHTGIAGISMGGYGAIKLSLKHPDLYSFVGVMSGPLDITRRPPAPQRWSQTTRIWSIFGYLESTRRNEDVFDLLARNPPSQTIHWFASCGKSDPLRPINQRFVNSLNKYDVPLSLALTPGGHDWESWNAAMPQLFEAAATSLH
jgi:S-formylglutathione hydrolase FrmB